MWLFFPGWRGSVALSDEAVFLWVTGCLPQWRAVSLWNSPLAYIHTPPSPSISTQPSAPYTSYSHVPPPQLTHSPYKPAAPTHSPSPHVSYTIFLGSQLLCVITKGGLSFQVLSFFKVSIISVENSAQNVTCILLAELFCFRCILPRATAPGSWVWAPLKGCWFYTIL